MAERQPSGWRRRRRAGGAPGAAPATGLQRCPWLPPGLSQGPALTQRHHARAALQPRELIEKRDERLRETTGGEGGGKPQLAPRAQHAARNKAQSALGAGAACTWPNGAPTAKKVTMTTNRVRIVNRKIQGRRANGAGSHLRCRAGRAGGGAGREPRGAGQSWRHLLAATLRGCHQRAFCPASLARRAHSTPAVDGCLGC